jgi:hypothetical protein
MLNYYLPHSPIYEFTFFVFPVVSRIQIHDPVGFGTFWARRNPGKNSDSIPNLSPDSARSDFQNK